MKLVPRTPERVLLKRHRKSAFRLEVLEPMQDLRLEIENGASGLRWISIIRPALARFGVTSARRIPRGEWELFIDVLRIEAEFAARWWLDQYQTPMALTSRL